MQLDYYASKKYGVRFYDLKRTQFAVNEVCLDSGNLKLKWLVHKAKTRHDVSPDGSPHNIVILPKSRGSFAQNQA